MMKSDFTVTCPYCKEVNDFKDDDWRDEVVDDSSTHEIDCLHCNTPFELTVHAIYSLTAEKIDGDDDEPEYPCTCNLSESYPSCTGDCQPD